MGKLTLTVADYAGSRTVRPVGGGIPLPEGAAFPDKPLALIDANGRDIAVQVQPLAFWKDGSIRWLLLDFMWTPKADAPDCLTLCYGDHAPKTAPAAPAAVALDAVLHDDGIELGAMGRVGLVLVDGAGVAHPATFQQEQVETAGPVRSTSTFYGRFLDQDGAHIMRLRLRVSRYAESGAVRLEPLLLVDSPGGILQSFRELRLDIHGFSNDKSLLGGTATAIAPEQSARLFQIDDETWRLEGTAAGSGKRAPGWLQGRKGGEISALAMRDFRQQWPKSLEVAPGRVSAGLFPAFSAGAFAHMEPWFKYQYLFEGNEYRLRTGQARRWEIWLQNGVSGEALCRAVNAPLVPAPDPTAALATGVWGPIAPAETPAMEAYDHWAEHLFRDYCRNIEEQRDYGAMNWGDWFGERKVNWGNHEYDTVNQLLIQFARTGNPEYFFAADAAARHSTEVDVVHHVNGDLAAYFSEHWHVKGYPPRPGMVHEHCVGHVGSFYPIETVRHLLVEHGVGHNDHPYLCLDPFNLGHVWTQGMVKHYFLTGDPFIRETAETIGDNLARLVEDGEYTFGIDDPHFGRAAGWPLLALAGAYELDFDDRFLRAMHNLTDRALDRQDPHCGGWLYELYPGHCFCTTRHHVGMAGFITSILINGLSEYHHLAGDERIPAAVERAVTFLIADTWVEQRGGWRYTSCPASSFSGQPGVTMMALVNAVRLAGNPEHLRVLEKAWQMKFSALLETLGKGPGQGKTFTAMLYGCAETVGLLATDKS